MAQLHNKSDCGLRRDGAKDELNMPKGFFLEWEMQSYLVCSNLY